MKSQRLQGENLVAGPITKPLPEAKKLAVPLAIKSYGKKIEIP